MPGPGQGIYGCDYHALVGIYAHVAEARVLMLQGQGSSAEVCPLFPTFSAVALGGSGPMHDGLRSSQSLGNLLLLR